MERYIDRLVANAKVSEYPVRMVSEKKEILDPQNPCVVCSVTLGKELHAGHMFLISVAEQIRNATDSNLPIILVNNNTGPRAAAALINISESKQISLNEAATLMDSGYLSVEEIVTAYRGRDEKSQNVVPAMEILSKSGLDIFAAVARETGEIMDQAGFDTQIVSESELVKYTSEEIENFNPNWTGTGFIPYQNGKRLVILQKDGNLTATGTMFSSIKGLSGKLNADAMLVVDSMGDSADASFVFSETSGASGIQIAGAGVGFEGYVASGSRGEAMTIKEIAESFYASRPDGNLRNASLYLTLSRPVSIPADKPNLLESFYDFYDNSSMIDLLITCNDEYEKNKTDVFENLTALYQKIAGSSSATSTDAIKLLQFLPQRAQSVFQKNVNRDLSASGKIDIVLKDTLSRYLQEFGYADGKNKLYENSFRKLAIRKNYYFNYLNGLLKTVKNIDSITEDDFTVISQMMETCMKRSGLL